VIEGDKKEVERVVGRLVMLAKQAGTGDRVARELATKVLVDEKLVVTYKTGRKRDPIVEPELAAVTYFSGGWGAENHKKIVRMKREDGTAEGKKGKKVALTRTDVIRLKGRECG